jgi:signal transduction histidine kinase/ActR/RegA family two-component response regulator
MTDPVPSHLRVLLDILDEPALLVRRDGLVLDGNAAMVRQLGLTRPALRQQRLAELVISPWQEAEVYLRRASGSRQSVVGALTLRRATGDEFSCRCYGNLLQPAFGDDAAILLLRCRERDDAHSPFLALNRRLDELTKEITRRQLAEARLRQLNRDLEARVYAEVAIREQVQERLAQAQRLEALGQLAAGVAHDFNNVLQAVSGGLTLIQSRAENVEVVRRFTRMALDAAERGATITGRLLAFARRGELRAEAVDTEELFQSLKEMLAPTLGAAVTMLTHSASQMVRLQADKGQLETVLVNLAVNARDAMPDGGTLTIAAEPEVIASFPVHPHGLLAGHYVRLTVADTGIGMDTVTLARAAEPFFTTKPVGRGTGLGLPMARGFAQQSGGGFAIESAPGRGTLVTLWFPQGVDAATVSEAVADGPPALVEAPAFRVLLVDDDPLVREVLAGQLENQGYRIVQASDGLAALAWLDRNESVDLLVTDFAMPGMNGLSLIKEVRRRCDTLPVLLLTGYADSGIHLAMDDITDGTTILLRKPVRGEELIERAAALLAGSDVGRIGKRSSSTCGDRRPG